MLRIENVSKYYGDYIALDNISFTIPKGSVFGLLGPNGAGKTSLIRILNQIILPDRGKVFLDGEELSHKHIAKIGYLPEERGLYKSMKVGEQAIYLARLKGLSKAEAKMRLLYWFEKLDILDWWDKKIQELSKGMAQKIQFIVTVLHQPKVLIFDEPFSGFDPVNANLIAKEILELKKQGTTIIFSTHRMESVEMMCDTIVLLNDSKKILEGTLLELQKRFKSNIFEVGVKTNNEFALHAYLKDFYTAEDGDFQTMHNDIRINLKLQPNDTSNELLKRISLFGEVTHFLEKIPTMDSIFMQAISNERIL